MFPHLEDIEIHCTSPELEWFGFHETSGFLYFPKIKITGYRQNPVCLAIAIASGSDSRWTTFECIFNIQIKGGLPKFIAKYHDAFTSPRFQRPNFSKTAGGCIKMVLTAKENSNNHTKDQKHYHRLYSDNDLRLAANLYGVGELLESQPIPKDFLKLLVEHNQTGHHEYKVKHEWRGRGPKSIFDTGRYFRCPVAASSTSGTFADHDRLELQNHILRNWNR